MEIHRWAVLTCFGVGVFPFLVPFYFRIPLLLVSVDPCRAVVFSSFVFALVSGCRESQGGGWWMSDRVLAFVWPAF